MLCILNINNQLINNNFQLRILIYKYIFKTICFTFDYKLYNAKSIFKKTSNIIYD